MKKLVYSVLFFNLLILASCSDDDSIAIETEQPDNEVISGNSLKTQFGQMIMCIH